MEIKTPKIGEKRKLMIPSGRIHQEPKIFEGFFIGKHPVENKWYQRLDFPEGYTFLVIKDDKQEIYCQRAEKLDLEYWCDGSDDPAYPIGIRVQKVEEAKLNKYELEFIKTKIKNLELIAQ